MKRDRQFCKFFALIAPSTQGEVAVEGKNIDFIFGKMQIFVGAACSTGGDLMSFSTPTVKVAAKRAPTFTADARKILQKLNSCLH